MKEPTVTASPETARNRPPRKRTGSTTTSTNVLRTRAFEMIAAGASVDEAAKAVGRSADTVREWQRAIAPAVEAKLAAVTEGIADGAAEARARPRRLAPEAADLVARIIRGEDQGASGADDPQTLRVRLQAATVALDRGGVPPKSETEHSGAIGNDQAPADRDAACRWHAEQLVALSGGVAVAGARELALLTLIGALGAQRPPWLMERVRALARLGRDPSLTSEQRVAEHARVRKLLDQEPSDADDQEDDTDAD